MTEKRRALGRGLGALIPQGTPANPPPADRRVPVAEIRPNPHQPRRYFDDARLAELADSIKQQGILQPLMNTAPSCTMIVSPGSPMTR